MKTKKYIILSIVFILSFSIYTNSFAISYPYNPGETLDPSCAPGSTNCTVNTSSSWSSSGEDIYFTGGNVGVGTSSPTNSLTVSGGSLFGLGVEEGSYLELTTRGTFYTDGNIPWDSSDVFAISGDYAYVVEGPYLEVVNISNPDDLSYMSEVSYFNNAVSIAIYGNYAFVGDFQTSQIFVLDISNPNDVNIITTISGVSSPEAFSISGNYLFTKNEGGLSIFDISDINNISLVGNFGNELINDITAMQVVGNYLYLVDNTNSSFLILNISDLGNITTVNSTTDNLYYPTDMEISGNYAYVTNGGNNLFVIFDISDPMNIVTKDTFETPYAQYGGMKISGNYAFVGDNHDSLYVLNVSDKDNITEVDSVVNNNIRCINSVALSGNNVYVADGCSSTISAFSFDSKIRYSNSINSVGGVAIGSYAGSSSALNGGLIVSGNVGIGTDEPSSKLDIKLGENEVNAFSIKDSFDNSLFLFSNNNDTEGINNFFVGSNAGFGVYDFLGSNFLGPYAGYQATGAYASNFLGYYAGQSATNAHNSNFLGIYAGQSAPYASYSNFLGNSAGQYATNSYFSNFLGYYAGHYAANASNSIFIGQNAGYSDTVDNTSNNLSSILIGSFTNTGGYSNSILLGSGMSGSPISNTKANQFMLAPSITEIRLRDVDYTLPSSQGGVGSVLTNDGSGGLSWGSSSSQWTTSGSDIYFNSGNVGVGTDTPNYKLDVSGNINFTGNLYQSGIQFVSSPISIVNSSNLFSTGLTDTGGGVTAITNSVFLGEAAGYQATNTSNSNFLGYQSGMLAEGAHHSNFLGLMSGGGATYAQNSNFLGSSAGYSATNAYSSNFLGSSAGAYAADSSYSNFLGDSAGYQSTNSVGSNFLGTFAGYQSLDSSYSNFLGYQAGGLVSNVSHSNFLGYQTGYNATNASDSNFLGQKAGLLAVNASNSIFIGRDAGSYDSVNNTGDQFNFSILIGSNTSTGGFSNSIAIGGNATNTATNQFMIGSTTRPINTTVWKGTSTTATLDTATGLITTSDERLKTNIADLSSDTLDKLLNVKTITFNWLHGDNDKTNIGFLAQDLQNYFPELVYENTDGYLGVNYANMTPVLTEAIREMNLKVEKVLNFTEDIPLREKIITWLSDSTNGITSIFSKEVHTEKICVKRSDGTERCVNGDDLDRVLGVDVIYTAQSDNSDDVSEEVEVPLDSNSNVEESSGVVNPPVEDNQSVPQDGSNTVELTPSVPSAESEAEVIPTQ